MKRFKYVLLLFILIDQSEVNAQLKTENVILITLDGLRWQEVFKGADQSLVANKSFVSDTSTLINKFWSPKEEERRKALMPFFWSTLSSQGQIFGSREHKNKVDVTNKLWFSYPGYNEILTGRADDGRITSNDKIDNPNMTILEVVNNEKRYSGKVAAFSSWDCFPYIINSKRSGVLVNSGIVEKDGSLTEVEKLINELMFEIPNPLGEVRLDAFTFYYAFEYLKRNRPHLLYISFDETDDFAHQGKYDLYLNAAHYSDRMIGKLWAWIENDPQYKGKTTMIITTDHGRGHIDSEAWRHHGSKISGADQIWVAVLGPDTPPIGEAKVAGQLFQNQIAKTIAQFLDVKFEPDMQIGEPIIKVFENN